LDEQIQQLKNTNLNQLKMACGDALSKVKKIAKEAAKSYYLNWSFKRFVFSTASDELGISIKSESTKKAVIMDFMEKDLIEECNQISSSTKKIAIIVAVLVSLGFFLYWHMFARVQS